MFLMLFSSFYFSAPCAAFHVMKDAIQIKFIIIIIIIIIIMYLVRILLRVQKQDYSWPSWSNNTSIR